MLRPPMPRNTPFGACGFHTGDMAPRHAFRHNTCGASAFCRESTRADHRLYCTMPTVDIIIPAYNAAHFLPFTLESVIAQTFPDWRILLIDDGSRDNTAEVIAPYQQRLGEKLLYIRQEN